MLNGKASWTMALLGVAALALLLAGGLAWMLWPADTAQAQGPAGHEPADVRVVPGDGILTVSWKVTSRPGVSDDQIRHALRWSQETGVWANPPCPAGLGRNDGFCLSGGVTQYVITGLTNDVATGVFVRSFVGSNNSERNPNSSQWVRIKGDNTTPKAGQQQPAPQQTNRAPTVANAIGDATIVNESGTLSVSLSGVFSDADGDSLTVTAKSSDTAKATVSVATDQSSLTVAAKARGTATITVTASDGKGGTVEDAFTVTVKAAPVVNLPYGDVTLSGNQTDGIAPLLTKFIDPDGDALTITATSSDTKVVKVSTFLDAPGGGRLRVTGVAGAGGTATVTVTAQDTDGNSVSDEFDVLVRPVQAQQQQAKSSDATLSGIAVYVATDHNPDNADNVLHDVTKALAVKPAVSAGVREYGAEMPEGDGYYVARANDGYYVAVSATPTAAAVQSIVIRGPESPLERRDPRDEVTSGEASGPWFIDIGYSLITIAVTAEDGANTEHYRLIIKRGEVDEPRGLRLAPGDGTLTLRWDANNGPAAPTHYTLRWRQAGETAWLNRATDGWRRYKTSYAADAPHATAADGTGLYPAASGSVELTGLDNGVAYEVQARGVRFHTFDPEVMNWLKSDWRSATGTPERPAATALTITPSSPTREYGGTDDLGYTVSGLIDGDAATDVVTGTLARAAGNDAGSYAIGLGTLAIASDYARKYALPSGPAVTTYTITPKAITAIGGVTVNARASDGTTTATFDTSAAQGTGLLPAELADFRAGGLQVRGSFPAATPGTHDLSVTYALRDHGAFRAANYSLSATAGTLQGELTEVAACSSALMLFADGVPAEGRSPITVTAGLSSPAGMGGAKVSLTATGTAASGSDYTLSAATVNIPAGATAGTATITVIDDTVDDDDETIILNAALAGTNLTAAPLTLVIEDNDDATTPTAKRTSDAGCVVPVDGDYDADDDGLIEVTCAFQLAAIYSDLDGDGASDTSGRHAAAYAAAYPNAATGMGCRRSSCQGYELSNDIVFETDRNGRPIPGTALSGYGRYYSRVLLYPESGWRGIGHSLEQPFTAIFDGNGHVIRNVYLRENSSFNGLFGSTGSSAVIRNVGVENALMSAGGAHVGGLVGHNGGAIINSYTTGSIRGTHGVGGLVGGSDLTSMIIGSYSTASVTGSSDDVGGLVGGNEGTIIASYATGDVDGIGNAVGGYIPGAGPGEGQAIGGLVGLNYPDQKIIASYATGRVRAPKGQKVGGLVGYNLGSIIASYSTGKASGRSQVSGFAYSDSVFRQPIPPEFSYWDTERSGLSASVHGEGKTTAELQGPVGYDGIYANWNLDLYGDGSADDPWNFGAADEYPVLNRAALMVAWGERNAADASLRRLSLSAGSLSFDPATTAYTVDVPSGASSVTVSPVTANPEATVAVNGVDPDLPVELDYGENVISLAVTAADGSTTRTYVLTVTRLTPTAVQVKYAALIAQMYQWRNGPEAQQYGKPHTDRWDRALLAFGETVADTSLTPMTADEAQAFADKGWERWVEVAAALKEIEQAKQRGASNTPPTVSNAIADVTIVSQSGTQRVSMSEVFADADGDALTVTAKSSDTAKATVSVDVDSDGLTVAAKSRGIATVTVTASDGNGGTVDDTFTVTVKAAPTVASTIADVSGLTVGDTRDVSLSGVFSDADGDSLTITAASSDTARVTAAVASDGSKLTLTGVAEGNATITVRAQDSDGNQASDAFEVSVAPAQQQAKPEGPEPWDIRIVPGDGQLTVTWKVGSHDVDDAEVRHALRWSQESGVWANPRCVLGTGANDGLCLDAGVTSYVITGLKNGVPTGVFVRSFTGDSASERSPESSKWVRVKGDNTTPKAAD